MMNAINKTTSTLAVAAIEEGTVIDHIHAGCALAIIKVLKLSQHHARMTLGLNLPSKRLGLKDIIKIEGRILSAEEINKIAVFSAGATINLIREFNVFEKQIACLPENIKAILQCPNSNCVSQAADVQSYFQVEARRDEVKLICHYCEKPFSREEIIVGI